MSTGWIKLHRKIVDWEWYQDTPTKITFLHLLLSANHEKKNWRGVEIDVGQKITSTENLAKETGLSRQQIRTALEKLKSTNEITTKATSKYTLIELKNYKQYQEINQPRNKRATNEQPTNNHKQESKEYKNDKNITTNVVTAEPIEHGNPDINWLLQEFKNVMGFESGGRGKKDRIFASHLLKHYSREQLWAMMTFCATNEFAPRVGSVEKLWFKRGEVIAGIKKLQNKSQSVVTTNPNL